MYPCGPWFLCGFCTFVRKEGPVTTLLAHNDWELVKSFWEVINELATWALVLESSMTDIEALVSEGRLSCWRLPVAILKPASLIAVTVVKHHESFVVLENPVSQDSSCHELGFSHDHIFLGIVLYFEVFLWIFELSHPLPLYIFINRRSPLSTPGPEPIPTIVTPVYDSHFVTLHSSCQIYIEGWLYRSPTCASRTLQGMEFLMQYVSRGNCARRLRDASYAQNIVMLLTAVWCNHRRPVWYCICRCLEKRSWGLQLAPSLGLCTVRDFSP